MKEAEGDRFGQKLASVAHRHVAPAHVDRALDHWAARAQRRIDSGLMSADQLNAMSDEQHEQTIKKLVADNPHIARGFKPPPTPAKDATAGKTFAPGKKNSMTEPEARAARRAKGITY